MIFSDIKEDLLCLCLLGGVVSSLCLGFFLSPDINCFLLLDNSPSSPLDLIDLFLLCSSTKSSLSDMSENLSF